jgi:hypothetical protein
MSSEGPFEGNPRRNCGLARRRARDRGLGSFQLPESVRETGGTEHADVDLSALPAA